MSNIILHVFINTNEHLGRTQEPSILKKVDVYIGDLIIFRVCDYDLYNLPR